MAGDSDSLIRQSRRFCARWIHDLDEEISRFSAALRADARSGVTPNSLTVLDDAIAQLANSEDTGHILIAKLAAMQLDAILIQIQRDDVDSLADVLPPHDG